MKKINGIYSDRLKSIRSFISFDFDLRKPLSVSEKRQITIYYNEIDKLSARPHYIYRPKRKDHLKKAQQFGQHQKELPKLKAAFIPISTEGKKPLIRWDSKNRITVDTDKIIMRGLSFNLGHLVENPEKHIIRIIKTDKQSKRFAIQAGRYEIPKTYSREKIVQGVLFYMNKYNEIDKNNYFGHWLKGLNGYDFKNQDNFDSYIIEKENAKGKIQLDRRNAKRRKKNIKRKNNGKG